MKKTITIIIAVFLFQSCSLMGDKEQVVNVENRYELSVPSFLTKTNELNQEASLQYMNGLRELYVIVINEEKTALKLAIDNNNLSDTYSNDLNGYANLVLAGLNRNINNPVQTEVIDTVINNMPAKLTTLKGEIQGIDVFYSIGIYEGFKQYYQILSWTLSSRESNNKQKMDKMLSSLKEIHNRKKP